MNSFFKECWWILTEGWVRSFALWAEEISVHVNVYRSVKKIKDTPISGDAMAWYRKEWTRLDD